MEQASSREDFLDRMVAICRLLNIEAPLDQEGDAIAYQLDLDEITLRLEHATLERPDTFLVRSPLGRLPPTDREASLTYLLQANAALAAHGAGALCLDEAGDEVSCVTRIDLAHTEHAVFATLLEMRDAARAWSQRFWPSASDQTVHGLILP